MNMSSDVATIASALRVSIGLLRRRLQQVQVAGELTMPEGSALARLDRDGPNTAAALARLERISPQSMGSTLAGLEIRGLIERAPDPADGRRIILSVSELGLQLIHDRRSARNQQLAAALAAEFSAEELALLERTAGLLERLAERI
jgi:DNA-binding MarR family transcriptional regulator